MKLSSKKEKEEDNNKTQNDESDGDNSHLIPGLATLENKSDYGKIPLNKYVPGLDPDISIFATKSIYGKRKTGKSVWAKWDIQAYKHLFPWAWVFTLTSFNSFWESFVPEKFVLNEFNAEILDRIMKRQRLAIAAWKELKFDTKKIDPRAIIVWDDYMGHDIRYNEMLARYYFTGRHFMTLNYFCAQYITMTPPSIRTNTDVAILFNTDHYPSLERYKEDFGAKLSKAEFFRLFYEATRKPHHFLAIVNDPNIPLEKKFYTGKAEFLDAEPQYILGCKEFWKGSEKQMEAIANGTMKRQIEATSELAKYMAAVSRHAKFPVRGEPTKEIEDDVVGDEEEDEDD